MNNKINFYIWLLIFILGFGKIQSGEHFIAKADESYAPFEFKNDRGLADGFNVDILKAVSKAMDMNITIETGPWDEIRDELINSEIDILTGMFRTRERLKYFDFSTHHFTWSYRIFTRKGSDIKSINDCIGKKIIVQKLDVAHEYLMKNPISDSVITYVDWNMILPALSQGVGDCAFVSYIQGTIFTEENNIDNIVPVGSPFLQNDYCFAVQKGERKLLAKLNEGMKAIKTTGQYDKIYQKWFAVYEEREFSFSRALELLSWILIPLIFLAVIGWIFIWFLKKQINLKTAELRNELQEKHIAQKKLEESELAFRTVFNQSPDEIIITDYETLKIIQVNDAFLRNHKKNKIDVIGKSPLRLGIGISKKQILDVVKRMDKDDLISTSEIQLSNNNNKRTYHASNKIIDYQGRKSILTISSDISQMVSFQEKLEETNDYLDELINSMPSSLIVVDTEMKISRVNQALIDFFEIDPNIISGQNLFYSLPIFNKFSDNLNSVQNTLRPLNLYRQEFPEFENMFFNISFYPVLLKDLKGIVIRLDDVSESEINRRQLIQAQKLESLSELAAGIAHDFNNILTGIISANSIMRKLINSGEPDIETLSARLQISESSASRASGVVNQLLSLSKKSLLKTNMFDLSNSINTILDICRNSFDKSIKINYQMPDEELFLEADSNQIEQCLLNIMINASHALTIMKKDKEKQGGIIDITVQKVKKINIPGKNSDFNTVSDYITITISDNGVGIKKENIDKIFEPFYTLKKNKGSGLGLAMVYKIINQHRGFLKVNSIVGKGTTFTIYLPSNNNKTILNNNEDIKVQETSGGEMILIIDDEKDIRELVGEMLEDLGYNVTQASRGIEGVEIFKNNSTFNLVILDLSMPDMSGEEVLDKLVKIKNDVRVMIISGFGRSERVENILHDFNAGFLKKPFTLEELINSVNKYIS